MEEKEIWKDVKGYEGFYRVSNLGRIKRVEHVDSVGHVYKERILTLTPKRNGYVRVHLSKEGFAKWMSLHRIVADNFLDNPNNYNVVNHLDCNPSNNRADNLEWTTYKGNMQYAAKLGRMKGCPENLRKAREKKKIPVYAIKGDERLYFDSQAEAARILHIGSAHIAECCRKEYGYNTVGGYEFEYADAELQARQAPKKKKMSKEELRERQRKAMLGNKIMLGKKLKEETKEKLRRNNNTTKSVIQYKKDGSYVAEYYSISEAKRVTGILHIYSCCKGDRKTAGGYVWKYKE